MYEFQPFRLVLAVLVFALTTLAQQQSEFRFTVLDEKGAVFSELKSGDVRITVDKQVVTPTNIKLDDGPISVLVMIDASLSQERMLPFEKQAAAAFIDGVLRPGKDRVAIAKFTNSPTLVQDVTTNFTTAKASLDQIRIVPPPGYVGGGVVSGPLPKSDSMMIGASSIFDALERLIGDLSYSGWSGERKAILLISDGRVTAGEKKLKDVVRASSRARIPVYVIGIGDSFYDGVDEVTLKKIASETGGVATFPGKESKLPGILPKLANPLRSQYVAMLPFDGPNGRKVDIDIVNPELKSKLRVLAPDTF